jgi:phage tail sheath protein FI
MNMAVAPTYPGVYIEELPSGVRTIAGVASSIAAFIGWAPKGPTDRAGLVLSWSDYERGYGGLHRESELAYAVYHFFQNGGRQAYVVRLVASSSSEGAEADLEPAATASGALLAPPVGESAALKLASVSASSPGAWGNTLGVSVTHLAQSPARFGISIVMIDPEGMVSVVETFENLAVDPNDSRMAASVINAGSRLVTLALEANVTGRPAAGGSTSQGAIAYTPLSQGADGSALVPNDGSFEAALQAGLGQLDRVDLFNLLVVPGQTKAAALQTLQTFCRERRAFLIADAADTDFDAMSSGPDSLLTGADAINAALYFPWVNAPDPLQQNRTRRSPPSGFVAGLYAKTDANRNVSKAPAGVDATVSGATSLTLALTDAENGVLNVQAINCLRTFPVYGTVVWGARTLRGHDTLGSEWKYVPVRRLALFLEESLYRGTQWVVFEPNDNALWAQVRLNIGSFMQELFRQGLFQGKSPREAYFVKCDAETTTQSDIDRGIVNIVIGFAPLKPAEFVIIKFQQMAGQTVS